MSSLSLVQKKLPELAVVPRNVKKSDCDMFEETTVVVLKESEQSLLGDETSSSTDPPKEKSPLISNSEVTNTPNESTVNTNSNVNEMVNAEKCPPVHLVGDESGIGVAAGSKQFYTDMKADYSLRPSLPDMDWANCSWADPDDSL